MIKSIVRKVARKAGFVPMSEVNMWDRRKSNLLNFQYKATDKEWRQLMMYFEIINAIEDVPGDVAEFGVAAGVSLVSFIRILRVLDRGKTRIEPRKIYGFDSFEGLPELSGHDYATDNLRSSPEMKRGGYNYPESYPVLFRYISGEPNAELVKGWFEDSVPVFFKNNAHVALALIHIDCDLYKSTKIVLEHAWDRLSPNGLILFDELHHPGFPGETVAFREFFKDKPGQYTLHNIKSLPAKRFLIKKQ